MGLIEKIKNKFNKKIDTSNFSNDNLISIVLDQSIKFGRTLEVKPGFVAVFVAKGKVADAFSEGSYRLEVGNIPILSRILKLTKPNKRGNLPNKFKAELYLVNLKQFENLQFKSFNTVYLKDKNFKNLSVKLEGKFSCEIFNPVEFIESMLTQYGLIKDSIAKTELSSWVAELTVKKVQKNKPSVDQLYARATECFNGLIDFLNKELFDCGVKILSLDVTKTIFPKKIYKSVNLDYTEMEVKKSDETIENVDFKSTNTKSNILISEQTENNDSKNQNNITETVIIEQNPNNTTEVENTEIIKTIDYKKCLNCGAYNSLNSEHCFNCKKKF